MIVVLAGGGVVLPAAAPEIRTPVVGRTSIGRGVAPDVPVTPRTVSRRTALDEPGMLIGRMVRHEVQYDLQPACVSLGQQTIEGVSATGTRTTTEIPAGAIGNEQPIKIVSEQWFSPELQVLVLTKHSDPRTGETTYRLTGVVRAEQARSLFDLPPDYTLQESVIRRQQQ